MEEFLMIKYFFRFASCMPAYYFPNVSKIKHELSKLLNLTISTFCCQFENVHAALLNSLTSKTRSKNESSISCICEKCYIYILQTKNSLRIFNDIVKTLKANTFMCFLYYIIDNGRYFQALQMLAFSYITYFLIVMQSYMYQSLVRTSSYYIKQENSCQCDSNSGFLLCEQYSKSVCKP